VPEPAPGARTLERVRRPVLEAESLPPAWYVSPEIHAREVERVFMRAWNLIGHDSRVKTPGDYAALEFAGVPFVVVRGRDGVVRAFANTCRHKGSRIVSGDGNARAFKCPYHGWVYALDGALTGAPQMEHSKNFERRDYGLVPIRLESWGRLMFVSFDATAPSLMDYLGELPAALAPYNFDDMIEVRRREFEIGCNWKIYYENVMEPYHTPTVHAGGLAGKNEDEGARMLSGNAGELFGAGGEGSPVRLEFGRNHSAIVSRHAGSRGLLPGDEPFPPIRTLAGRTCEGSIWAYAYPSTTISCQREGLWYIEIRPLGPERTALALGTCFPAETVRRPDFGARVEAYYRRLDQTAAEDVDVVLEQQRGLASPLARAGRLSHLEAIPHAFRNWLLDQVLDEP